MKRVREVHKSSSNTSSMVAIRNDGTNYEAHLGAARIYNKMKQPERAADLAKKASDIKSTGEASWEYAQALIALNRAEEAKPALEKLLESPNMSILLYFAIRTTVPWQP